MSPVGDNISNIANAIAHGGMRQRILQKLKPTSGLQDDGDQFAPPERKSFRKPDAQARSRSGTGEAVPFRHRLDAPRLDAAFVAQLLGQLMPGERVQPAACTAYGGVQSPNPLFDKKL
ncbi:MAG: hypothetical protein J0H61_00770 [Alphaproteobacteria bacterium]|nr:hypothetical protein [Alphaproteobacteria bacterium]